MLTQRLQNSAIPLNAKDQEIAETLFRAWSAEKRTECAKRQLGRIAEALAGISQAINAELNGKGKEVLLPQPGGGFAVGPAPPASITGPYLASYELPTSEDLSELLHKNRAAEKDLAASRQRAQGL